ncbi:MAG: hypothetical protein VKS61_00500 [Candidatus Sericytochromatia bacterium]|nr:hypothetical protein [Candidatus Sericytochromatia bacterium]
MAATTQLSSRLVALLLGAALTGCAKASPATPPMASRLTRPAVAAPAAPPVVAATTAPVATPTPTGTVALSLNALIAPGITGVGIELTGPGLTAPIGKVLTPKELETSNTLVFEHLPAGALTARVVAFGEADQPLAEVSSPVTIKGDDESRVALLLSATPDVAKGGAPVSLRFVAPETLASPKPEPAPAGATPARPVSPASRALSLEIVDKQVLRKFLLLKRLVVTVRVTNDNPTETLRGEVKVQFHKLKGLLTKTDTVVETLTAPVESLAPGKSMEVTLTSTVSAEDAKATVHTVVASSSASTRDEE